jgi:hypothetical protein
VTALDNFQTSRKLAREQVQVLLIGFSYYAAIRNGG